MKGYTMVLLVNALLLLLLTLAAFAYATTLDATAARCRTDTPANPQCAQADDVAAGARTLAPYLAAGSVLLGGLAWATRRPPRPNEPL